MTKIECCPKCGAALPSNAPAGICPKCLMQAAIDPSVTDAPDDAATHARGPNPIRLADAATLPPSDAEIARSGSTGVGPGTRVRYFGEYELLEEIARGGMGVVYKARQRTLKRIVALKMILSGHLAGPEEVKRFQVEAEAAAKLNHPNIVPIFEIGQHEGQHYFSMAFVDGESLAHKLVAGPMLPRPAVELIKKVADAVAYAHLEGVVHRDLKPANVLIDKDGEPRITDFGLAKRISTDSLDDSAQDSAASLTATGDVLGTPSYMSPEQAGGENEKIGPLSDVYSLGAILYCLLTGRPPFQGASPIETLIQVLQLEPVSPRLLNPKVPADLETICLKCLQKEPSKRYSSGSALADDLGRYLRHEPIVARPVGSIERTVNWAKRRPTIAALAAGILIVAATGFAGVTWQWRSAERSRQAEAAARENTQDTLSSSLWAQARAVRLAGLPGRRWQVLELLKEAEQLRSRKRTDLPHGHGDESQSTVAGQIPRRFDLRTEGTIALLLDDARVAREWVGILATSFSPDGRFAAHVRTDQEHDRVGLSIIDLATGKEMSNWGSDDVNPFLFGPLALGPDARLIASASLLENYGHLTVWKLPERKRLHEVPMPKQPTGAGQLNQTNEKSATPISQFGAIHYLSFSPDGRYLCAVSSSGSVDRVVLANIQTGAEGSVIGLATNGIVPVFDPNGTFLAFVSGDHKITLWNVAENRLEPQIDLPLSPSGALGFAPDGQLAIACSATTTQPSNPSPSDTSILFWDVKQNREIRRVAMGRLPKINILGISPNGEQIAISYGSQGAILVSDLSAIHGTISLDQQVPLKLLGWTNDGKHLVSGGLGLLKIWEFASEAPISVLRLEAEHILASDAPFVFSPDRQFVAVDDHRSAKITLYDAGNGKRRRSLAYSAREPVPARRISFNPHKKELMRLSNSDLVTWELETGTERARIEANPNWGRHFSSVGFGPDGQIFLGGSYKFRPSVFEVNVDKQRTIWEGPRDARWSAVVSPDGRLATAGISNSTEAIDAIPVFDISTGKQRFQLSEAPNSGMQSLCDFSPDGRWLLALHLPGAQAADLHATASSASGAGFRYVASGTPEQHWTADIWDALAAKLHMQIDGPSYPIATAFSPNGRYLAVGMSSAVVRLWDMENGEALFDWRPSAGQSEVPIIPYCIAFTSDNSNLAIPDSVAGGLRMLNLNLLNQQLSDAKLSW